MFISLARALDAQNDQLLEANANLVLGFEAPVLSYALEEAWSLGGPGALATMSTVGPAPVGTTFAAIAARMGQWTPIWDHLIYAYMIENTRIYEIFRRVLWEFAHGERLGIPQRDETHRWLQTTEELFYKDASPYQSWNLVSRLRQDIAATRRNAYHRMFGMDLNHGRDGSSAYPYEKAAIANREFVATFEEFLRQVWRGIENANNQIGPNSTDSHAILDLSLRLQAMLIGRRGSGANLAREEFLAVALQSWFAMTVTFNTSIVIDMHATGPTPEERLRQIGDRVGVPMHPQAHSYFQIAPPISTLLQELEAGDFDTIAEIETLYAPGTTAAPNAVRDDLAAIVHHWSIISGRDIKAPRTPLSPTFSPPPAMMTVPAMPSASAPSLAGTEVIASGSSGNGSVPSRA